MQLAADSLVSLKILASRIFQATKEVVLVNGMDYLQRGLGPGALHPGAEEVSAAAEAAPFLPIAWFPGKWSWEDKSPMTLGCWSRK